MTDEFEQAVLQMKYQLQRYRRLLTLAVVIVIGLVLVNTLFYSIDPEEEGVVLRFGRGALRVFFYISRSGPRSGMLDNLLVSVLILKLDGGFAGSLPALGSLGKLAFPKKEYGTRHKNRGIGPHKNSH